MSSESLRALVVDDDAIARRMLSFALEQEGFDCVQATDGIEAVERFAQMRYDLVVTDLLMPNKHGHSLAVELLAGSDRPVVMIHTSVDEPRMTKDLLTRGVDDIVYKPTNYKTFAVRARFLVNKRRSATTASEQNTFDPNAAEGSLGAEGATDSKVDVERPEQHQARTREARRVEMSNVLPISQAAIRVYELTTKGDSETGQIAAAIEMDATLAAELLVLGNSAHYNPAGSEVADLEPIVVRIGRRRIGELALATAARAAARAETAPWVDWDLTWQRSMAAGLAVEELADASDSPELVRGLFLSAIFHPLGRIVLASVFPDRHEPLTRRCRGANEPLCQAELEEFGRPHTAMMAELLRQWKVPHEITAPLAHALDSYRSLSALSEIDRTRVELLKVAILAARVAAARWQPYDLIELPPLDLTERLPISSPGDLVNRTRSSLAKLLAMGTSRTIRRATPRTELNESPVTIGYHRLRPSGVDWLATALESMGFDLRFSNLEEQPQSLVNCLDVDPAVAVQLLPPLEDRDRILIAAPEHVDCLAEFGRTVSLPCSYGALRQSFERQTATSQ